MTTFPSDIVFWDLETHSVTERWAKSPTEFIVIGGYSWGESEEIHLTSDVKELCSVVSSAAVNVGHNSHGFDLGVLFGRESMVPVTMARERRVLDTLAHATLANPAPEGYYLNRQGKQTKSTKPEEYRRWYSLDNQAFQLGTDGKSADLSEMADRHLYTEEIQYGKTGKELKTRKKTRIPGRCCGYGFIPLDDEDFREYLRQDVRATREVARALIARHPMNMYAWRNQVKWAIDAQITRNRFRLDIPMATKRVKDMAEVTAHGLNTLNNRYPLPLHKKKPLSTTEGKQAILNALKDVGVREMELDRTPTGAPSFSADSVKKATGWVETDEGWVRPSGSEVNHAALDLGDLVAELAGQRSLAELALASVDEDGWAYPDIQSLQRSGRTSVTKPGLTIWDDSHKDYWIADDDDHVLVEFDYSNADQRMVAALSGDRKYAVRFQPGQDGHLINAWAVWTKEVVGIDKHDPETAKYRNKGKRGGHAWGYRVGAKKLAASLGVPFEEAKKFLDALNKEFSGVVRWQDRVVATATKNGFVVNDWGRRMPITGRAFTQGPALLGQSGTLEILTDGLIQMPPRILRMVRLPVHDALVLCMPKATLDRDIPFVVACLSQTWKPKTGGQTIEFTVGHGEPSRTWLGAVHS